MSEVSWSDNPEKRDEALRDCLALVAASFALGLVGISDVAIRAFRDVLRRRAKAVDGVPFDEDDLEEERDELVLTLHKLEEGIRNSWLSDGAEPGSSVE